MLYLQLRVENVNYYERNIYVGRPESKGRLVIRKNKLIKLKKLHHYYRP
jgi:hypothetical protein